MVVVRVQCTPGPQPDLCYFLSGTPMAAAPHVVYRRGHHSTKANNNNKRKLSKDGSRCTISMAQKHFCTSKDVMYCLH